MTSPSNFWSRQLDMDLYLAANPATDWQDHPRSGTANTENHAPTHATHTTSAQHSVAPAQSAAGGSADAGVDYSDLSWVNPFVFGQPVEAGVKESAHAPEHSHAASHPAMRNSPSTSRQPPATFGQSINHAPLLHSSAPTVPQSFAASSQADHAPPPEFLSDIGPPMTEEETDALLKSFSAVWSAPEVNPPAPVNQKTGYTTPAPQAPYQLTAYAQQGMCASQPSSAPSANVTAQEIYAQKTSASAYPPRTFEEPRQHRVGPLTDASNTVSNPAQKVFGWPPQADSSTPADQNAGFTAPISKMMYGQDAHAQQGPFATAQPDNSKANAQVFNAQQASASAYQQRTFGQPRPHHVPLTDVKNAASTLAPTVFDWSSFAPATLRAQVNEMLRRKAQAPETRQSTVQPSHTDVGNGTGQYATPSRLTPGLPRSLTFPPPSTGGFGSISTGGLAHNLSTTLPASGLEAIDETPEIVARATKRKADSHQEGRGAVKQVRFRSPDREEQAKPEEVGAPEAVNAPAVTRSRNVSTHTENHSTSRMTPLPGPLTTSTTASAAPHWTDSARRDGAWIIHLPRGMVFASYPTHPSDLYLIPASDARQLGCKILQLGQVLTAPQMDLPHPVEFPERGGADDARSKPVAKGHTKPAAVAPTSTTAGVSEAASAIRPARQRSASLSSLSSLSSDEDSATARPSGGPDKEHRYCPWQTSPGERCGYDYWTDSSLAQDLSFRAALTRHTYPHRSAALGEACPEYLKLKGPRAIDLRHVKVRCGMWEEGAPAACGASVCYGDLIDHIIDVHYNAGQAA